MSQIFSLYFTSFLKETIISWKISKFQNYFLLGRNENEAVHIFLWVTSSQMRHYFLLRTFTWDVRWFYSVIWIYGDTHDLSLPLHFSSSSLNFCQNWYVSTKYFLIDRKLHSSECFFPNLLNCSVFMVSSIFFKSIASGCAFEGIWPSLNALWYCRVVFNSGQITGPANRCKKGGGTSRGRKKPELLIEPLISRKMFV